ncbi:DUF5615 family PIN-like protein [Agrobacterium tumefaciens]|uniref:DUF5615 family PIN-like protein n=1 Tax=Agrobacterium tumefaciens TaxID=358 RepID=UPI001F336E41|nr:DUF5615 family PIN-like protein [Agrobacterium tumefaciens]
MAQAHGHDCFHVNWLGLSGETDWDLMPRIIEEDFTFVTNNVRAFSIFTPKKSCMRAC